MSGRQYNHWERADFQLTAYDYPFQIKEEKAEVLTDGPRQYNWLVQEVCCRLRVYDKMSPIFLIKYFFQINFWFSAQQKFSQEVPA